ncbi:MAG: sigma-70 family RNA polymerase sigma factor [Lentimicrobium sp.]|jgi:DNA-directed RNA polymerase specialized sigma24 family protein|nr:sigma-70 family RNA polymerase sigma factor [Lentimicrobium sp.]
MKSSSNDSLEVLKGIAEAKTETLEMIYRNCYLPVQKLVINNSGTNADAEDIFQDTVTIVFRRARQDELHLFPNTGICTLLFAIAHKLWLQKLTYSKKVKAAGQQIDEVIALPLTIENEINGLESKKLRICQKHFMQMAEKCRLLMKLFMKGLQMKEIAEIMDFDSEDQAKTAKYRCKKTLANRILNDKEYKALL